MDREGDNFGNPINEIRRVIPNMGTFSNAMRFNWNNAINVGDQRLGSLPLGALFAKVRRK